MPRAVFCRNCGEKLERGDAPHATYEQELLEPETVVSLPIATPIAGERFQAPARPGMLLAFSAPLRLDTGVASFTDVERPLVRRPLTIALLMIASFGLYFFVWFYRVRRLAEERLGLPNHAAVYTALMIVPGVNLVAAVMTSDLLVRALGESREWRTKFLLATLAFFFLAGCAPLPYPWWALVLLSFVPVAMLHARIVRSIIADRVINKRMLALPPLQTALVAGGGFLVILAVASLIVGATPLGYLVGFSVLALGALGLRWFATMRAWKTVDRPQPVDHFGFAS